MHCDEGVFIPDCCFLTVAPLSSDAFSLQKCTLSLWPSQIPLFSVILSIPRVFDLKSAPVFGFALRMSSVALLSDAQGNGPLGVPGFLSEAQSKRYCSELFNAALFPQ